MITESSQLERKKRKREETTLENCFPLPSTPPLLIGPVGPRSRISQLQTVAVLFSVAMIRRMGADTSRTKAAEKHPDRMGSHAWTLHVPLRRLELFPFFLLFCACSPALPTPLPEFLILRVEGRFLCDCLSQFLYTKPRQGDGRKQDLSHPYLKQTASLVLKYFSVRVLCFIFVAEQRQNGNAYLLLTEGKWWVLIKIYNAAVVWMWVREHVRNEDNITLTLTLAKCWFYW